MKRSPLLIALAVSAVAACSYYDTSLLKFTPDDPVVTAGAGGESGATSTGGVAGVGASGGSAGAAGDAAGSAGVAGAAGATAGEGGTAGAAGTSAGASGAAGDPSGGSAGAAGSSSNVCARATPPTRPLAESGGSGGGAGSAGAGGGAAGAGGAGAGAGGAGAGAGASGAAGAGATGPGYSTPDNLIFAIRSMDFGEEYEPTKSEIGFDIDGSCTCIDAPGEICKPWQPRDPLCDGPGGRDNSFPRLLKELIAYSFADNSAAVSKNFDDGSYTILIRVQGWNLQPDDPEVTVTFYTSDGTLTPPSWDAKDSWTVFDSCVTDGDIQKPKLRDTAAYVSGGRLVASLPSIDVNDDKVVIQLNDSLGLALTGTVLVAKLDQLLGRYSLTEGTLSGRWRDKDFFAQVGHVKSSSFGSICKDNFLYPQVKSSFCKYADVAGNVADATGICSAMSMAIGFTAQEARLGAVVPAKVAATTDCSAATDPKTDNCSTP